MRTLHPARIIGSAALSAALLLGMAACGEDTPDAGSGGCEVQVSQDLAKKPTITIPDCATKPSRPQFKDVVAGSGEQASAGDSVKVKYVGVSWSTKEQFDASWDRGPDETFSVSPLGRAQVIDGWNQGLVGARPGSRRLLVLTPEAGYGAGGSGAIGPNETLVFVVDVVSVDPA